jgi:adenylylsulfate kinase
VSWAIWVTGPPGSGKSSIARAAAEALRAGGTPVELLELDAMRRVVTPEPAYTDAERVVVYRALVWVAAALVDAELPVLVDATAHRREWRDLARATIPRFAEVQLVCSLETCRAREAARPAGSAPRGIYARAGRPGATVPGVDVPYEPAHAPEVTLDTERESVAAAAARVVALAAGLGGAPAASGPPRAGEWAVWITGLPGSGKTTLAFGLARRLEDRGVRVRVLDLAAARDFVLGGDTPATSANDEIIHRTLVYAAKRLTDAGVPVVVDATAQRRAWRQLARALIARFGEVQLVCPREVCDTRERAVRWGLLGCAHAPRGARPARAPDVVVVYEPAVAPELTIDTYVEDPATATAVLFEFVVRLASAVRVEERAS